MTKINSNIITNSELFLTNSSEYKKLISTLNNNIATAISPETEEAKKLTRERNKLTCSERIDALIDRGAPVLDIGSLAGTDLYDGVPPGAGIRTVISTVCGKQCMIVANNSSVKGGTYFPMTVRKHIRAQEIALENRLPCIYLVDSGGAFLPLQAEVFPDRFHFGRIFYNQANLSRLGVPQISVVLGSSTAGGAYVPAMSDEVIMVDKNAAVFLGGPPLVKAATGEEVSTEELGGARVHSEKSGVSDYLATDEHHALSLARRAMTSLGSTRAQTENFCALTPDQTPEEPCYATEEICGIIGTSLKRSFPVVEILARLLDGSRFDEFKPLYGETLKCGFGHIMGYKLGIIANDGILFSESALKGAHFIELCSQRQIPLLFLQNIAGFMVGKQYEHEGIAKHGAKMVNAVACARVPKFTIIIGGSFGAGNYSMCGRAYDPRFIFTWPNSRISVMGGEQAASVLTQVQRATAERKGEAVNEEKLKAEYNSLIQKYETEGSPYYATARMWDDGIISPLQTRTALSIAFAATGYNPSTPNTFGVFRM